GEECARAPGGAPPPGPPHSRHVLLSAERLLEANDRRDVPAHDHDAVLAPIGVGEARDGQPPDAPGGAVARDLRHPGAPLDEARREGGPRLPALSVRAL